MISESLIDLSRLQFAATPQPLSAVPWSSFLSFLSGRLELAGRCRPILENDQ